MSSRINNIDVNMELLVPLRRGGNLSISRQNPDVQQIKNDIGGILKKDLIKICQEFEIHYRKSWTNEKLKNAIETHFTNNCQKIRTIDLCSGAGGGALGFRNTGYYDHVCMVEIDKKCCETLVANKFSNVVCADLTRFEFNQPNIDLIVIGSPCQSFSYSGQKKGFEDPRGEVLIKFIQILNIVKPSMFLIENVRGLASHDGGNSLKRLLSELRKKYFVKYQILNSADYSVPQKRQRIFIFGSIFNDKFQFPKPTGRMNLKQAIGDLENTNQNPITASYNERKLKYFKKIPQGGCWVDLPKEDQKEYLGNSYESGGGKRGILRRLSYTEPSLTILCSPQQKQTERCHPTQHRPLTIRESARIQTFPDTYIFKGSISSQYKQIGNAIPVSLAQILAESIYLYWNQVKYGEYTADGVIKEGFETKDTEIKDINCENNDMDMCELPKKNQYVDFVSDEIFEELCLSLFNKYQKVKSDVDIYKNLIDPFKLAFDLHGYDISEDEWVKREVQRQIDKIINNEIGYFHQKLLGHCAGWINIDDNPELKKKYKVDLCNVEKTKFFEIKNKFNTMNCSSRKETIHRLKNIKQKHPNAQLYIGMILSKYKSSAPIDGVNLIYGREIYQIITSQDNAFEQCMFGITKCLQKISGKSYCGKFHNKCFALFE